LGFIKRMAHATSHQMNKWLLQPIFFFSFLEIKNGLGVQLYKKN
jgi:hypothetical protein